MMDRLHNLVDLVRERTQLKCMLAMARELPEGAQGRDGAIAKLEIEILLIKLRLNCAY